MENDPLKIIQEVYKDAFQVQDCIFIPLKEPELANEDLLCLYAEGEKCVISHIENGNSKTIKSRISWTKKYPPEGPLYIIKQGIEAVKKRYERFEKENLRLKKNFS